MKGVTTCRLGVLAALASIHLASPFPVLAAVIPQESSPASFLPALPPVPDAASTSDAPSEAGIAANLQLIQSLSRGLWTTACDQAAGILGRQRPDIDALGVFAICAALRSDEKSTSASLDALKAREATPPYYATLVEGILQLQKKAPEEAQAIFSRIREQRASDPLALYFIGEAHHAQKRSAEAIAAFERTLETWPEYAPAIAAIARLKAGGASTPEALQSAISLTEQATRIDPANLGYWRQLADLCERAGDTGRANAIRLQWLRPRVVPQPGPGQKP